MHAGAGDAAGPPRTNGAMDQSRTGPSAADTRRGEATGQVMRFTIFFSISILIVAAAHYYFWLRLVRDPALPPVARVVGGVLLALLALGIPASFFIMRALSPAAARVVLFPLYLWMGLMLLLLTLLAAGEVVRLGVWVVARLGYAPWLADPAHRLLVARWMAALTVIAALGLATWGMRNALGGVVVRRVRVVIPKLPRALSGTTIAQLTDLHVGPTLGRSWLQRVVAQVNALRADLVVVTGDLMDGRVAQIEEMVSPIGELRARRGVYLVTGNHEYYSRVQEWLPELQRLGLRVLRNERVTIGDAAGSFDLAGTDDLNARGMAPGHGQDLRAALAGRDGSRVLVLLAHQPRTVLEAARLGVDLQLSGHTHGGQFWPWKYFVYLQQPYLAGLARCGATWIYVSDGTGFWGPPLRLGTRSEIAHLTLVSSDG
jgi:uncharacterized protein